MRVRARPYHLDQRVEGEPRGPGAQRGPAVCRDRLVHQHARTDGTRPTPARGLPARRLRVGLPGCRRPPATPDPRQVRVHRRDVPQRPLGAPEHQRQPVHGGRAVQRRHPHFPQEVVEAVHAVPVQHPRGGHVERPRQRRPGRYRTPEVAVVVLGHVPGEPGRHIGHQRRGQDLARVQHACVEQGLEDAPGAAGTVDQVDGVARAVRDLPPAVPHIRHDLEGAVVDHERGQVADPHGGQGLRLPRRDVSHQPLERRVQGARVPAPVPRVLRRERLEKVRCGLRQRPGRVRQRLQQGQLQLFPVDRSPVPQPVEQPVPPLQQLLAAPPRVDRAGVVRQDRQHGRLRPGQVAGPATEVAPRRRLKSDHVPAEGRVGCVQREHRVLACAEFEPQRERRLDELLPVGAGPGAARHADHLHREGAAAAHDLARAEVRPRRPGQREGIDPGMRTETLVLGCDRGGRELLRHRVARRETPLPVGCDPRAQQRPVAGLHYGRYRVVEERVGKPGGEARGHDQAGRQTGAPDLPRMPPCAPSRRPQPAARDLERPRDRPSRRLPRGAHGHRSSSPSPSTTRTPIPSMRPYTEASYIVSTDTAGR